MEWLNSMTTSGVLRQLIQGLGSSAVTAGIITAEHNILISGAIASLIGVGLEIISSRNKRNTIKALEATNDSK